MLLRDALGETLRDTRTKQRRTLREVSSLANVSLGYLSEVERGRKEASSELLAAICEALDVELSDLLDTASSAIRGTDAAPVATAAAPRIDARRGELRIVMPYRPGTPSAPVA